MEGLWCRCLGKSFYLQCKRREIRFHLWKGNGRDEILEGHVEWELALQPFLKIPSTTQSRFVFWYYNQMCGSECKGKSFVELTVVPIQDHGIKICLALVSTFQHIITWHGRSDHDGDVFKREKPPGNRGSQRESGPDLCFPWRFALIQTNQSLLDDASFSACTDWTILCQSPCFKVLPPPSCTQTEQPAVNHWGKHQTVSNPQHCLLSSVSVISVWLRPPEQTTKIHGSVHSIY